LPAFSFQRRELSPPPNSAQDVAGLFFAAVSEQARPNDRRCQRTRHRGIRRVAGDFLLNLIAYNLVRIPKLVPARWHQRENSPR